LENSKGGSVSGSDALTDDLRKEISHLKGRIEGLEKELNNQEIELKAAKISLKDKNNDPMVKNLSTLFQQFSLHLTDIQSVQKEMDKIFQLHKTTWDLQNLQNQLNLIENNQSAFSEEIFNSLHSRDHTIDKDRNNNSTITARSAQRVVDKFPQKTNENFDGVLKDSKKNVEQPSGTQTLKRKRDSKSPSAKVTIESPSSDATSRKLSSTTATILVSKTKTKTGLPLLLKK
jgi:ribosomal protein S21